MNPNQNRPPSLCAHVDKSKLYFFTAALPVLFALLYFVLKVSRFELIVWGSLIVIALVYAVKELVRSDVRVVVDHRGVLDKRNGMGTIAWKDIERVYVEHLNNVPHICLDVRAEKKYLAKRSSLAVLMLKFNKRANNISPFNINAGVLDVSADEIYDAIVSGTEHYAASRTPHRVIA